jgi:hypothetical protein
MTTSKEFKIASWLIFLAYPVLAVFDVVEYDRDKMNVFIIVSMMFFCTAAILKAIEMRGGK